MTIAAMSRREPALSDLLRLMPAGSQRLRVLEIETEPQGGASAALLADRLGATVVSVSQSPSVISTARATNANDDRLQFRRITLTAGWPLSAPYDLVLVWPFMTLVPRAWPMQCAPGGLIICPVHLRPPGGLGVARLTIDRHGSPCLPASLAFPAPGSRQGAMRWDVQTATLHRDGDGYAVSGSGSGGEIKVV